MTPERWQQIDQLFEAALEVEPGDRTGLLEQKCAGDEELRREVEALLAAHEQSSSFIEEPPSTAAAELLGNDPGESLIGQQIGRYKVLSLLGAGGMGEVYSASDSKLGRKVALKVLPARFTQDTDRVRRFERESRAASALNHPNILTIHEVEQVDGRPCLVTEFIEGVTLRQSIASTRMELSEKLDIATQVASALAAAHEAGIVHRDIKPENLMLRRDRIVKVLDFGIAKLTEQIKEGVDVERLAEIRASALTDIGAVLGTATYMSPEQAQGQKVDARTDIWSLGVVLYEMVAGRVPFEGKDVHRQIIAIQDEEPTPLSRFEGGVPERLEEIVRKALAKDPEERYQTAQDLLTELRHLKRKLDFDSEMDRPTAPEAGGARTAVETTEDAAARTGDVQAARSTSSAEYLVDKIRGHNLGVMLVAAVLVITAAAIGVGLYKYLAGNRSQTQPAAPFQRVEVTRLTTNGKSFNAAISPDGKYVAYVVRTPGSPPRPSLWIRQVATGSDVPIIPPSEFWYSNLMFSRDGNFIYYIKWGKDGVLYQMPVLGGMARKLRDVPPGVFGWDLALSPDGKQIAFARNNSGEESALMVANALDDGGEQKLVTRQRPDLIRVPMWSPDGKKIACAVGRLEEGAARESIVEVRVTDGAEALITPPSWKWVYQGAWLPDGSGLIMPVSDADNMYGQYQLRFISYPSGEVRRITNDLSDHNGVSLTADSTALVTVQTDSTSSVWVVPNGEASRAKQVLFGPNSYFGYSWTPDGKIVYETEASGNQDLWIMDQDGSHQKQLTVDTSLDYDPSVTPDGRYIVFTSTRTGHPNIWRMDIDGGNPKQLTKGVRDFVPQCSPDGEWVVYSAGDPVRMTLWRVRIDGGDPVQLTDYVAQWPSVSPDGKMVAAWYLDEQAKTMKLAVIPFAGGRPVKILDIAPTVETWGRVRWTVDGKALTYVDSRDDIGNIWSQPVAGGPPKQLTDFKSDLIGQFEWSRDGKQLVCDRNVFNRDVVLIRDFR